MKLLNRSLMNIYFLVMLYFIRVIKKIHVIKDQCKTHDLCAIKLCAHFYIVKIVKSFHGFK